MYAAVGYRRQGGAPLVSHAAGMRAITRLRRVPVETRPLGVQDAGHEGDWDALESVTLRCEGGEIVTIPVARAPRNKHPCCRYRLPRPFRDKQLFLWWLTVNAYTSLHGNKRKTGLEFHW